MGGPAQRYYCVGRPAGRIQKWRRRRVVGRFARSRNILVSGQGHATHMWERRILLSWQGQDVRRSFIAFWGATSRMLNGTAWAVTANCVGSWHRNGDGGVECVT